MDRKELMATLHPFRQQCDKEGYEVRAMCLEDAYPGIQPTSFIVKIVATDWLHKIDCSEALKSITDILWKMTDAKTRESIFTIAIYDENEALHCLDFDESYDANVLHRIISSESTT